MLDVINASIYKTEYINKLKQIAQEHFKAQDIRISPLKLLLGSIFAKGITSYDQKGPIKTATFTSIANYLEDFNLAQEVITIEM